LALQFRRLVEGCPQRARAQVEEVLRAKFHKQRTQARQQRMYLAAAAAIVMTITAYFAVTRTERAVPAEPDAAQILAGFTPLPYAASGAPLGQAVVLRVQLPVESVEINAAGAATERTRFVPADLLIGEDDVPRAVRLAQ
jgi:hypothetical protein